MSNIKTTSAKINNGSLAPRLRFPEFRNAGKWQKITLADICDILPGYTFPESLQGKQYGQYPFCKVSDISKAVSEEGGLLHKALNYVDYDDLSILRAKPLPIGTTVFAKIGEALRLNRRAITTVECLIDNNAVGIKAKPKESIDYFLYILSQLIDLSEYCGGAVPAVSKTVLESIAVVIPNLEEQQRISDCLSSLDERIAAETSKLDRLKEHKKGLLKRLFPEEGKTKPTLRFPEFRNVGEWKWKKLKDVCKINPSSETLPQIFIYIDLESVSSGKLLYKKLILLKDAPSRAQRLIKNGDILFQMVRPYQRNNLYCNFDDNKNYVASTGYALLRTLENSMFLYHEIHCDNFVDRVISKCTGSNYPAINSSHLSELVISTTILQEQQRIAECLSSLDELITAQAKKIDLLKDHKKGLMQQLFPRIDEVMS